jgi:8-oxo-dGTP diphosphatase
MDPTAPEGCAGAGLGWAGQPLDTAHLRLRAASAGPPRVALALRLLVEERLSGRRLGEFAVDLASPRQAKLSIFWPDHTAKHEFLTESLRRCLRMLFDNFGVGLVTAEIPDENQGFIEILAPLGFIADEDGVGRLTLAGWQATRLQRKILLVVAAALIDPDGRVLLARRPPGKSMAGQWEFPGGKLAAGESPEQALIRELREELGIETSESCLAPIAFASHDYDHFHLAMPLFALRQWSGQPRPIEGQTLAWVSKQHLADYPMPPADIPLVAHLRDWL